MRPLSEALKEWLKTDQGDTCATGTATGEYLRNRITCAFEAGWLALERRIEEAINGKKDSE